MLNKPVLLLATLSLLICISHPSRADYNMPIDTEDSLDAAVSRQQMKPLLDTEWLNENAKRQTLIELFEPETPKEKYYQMTETAIENQRVAAITQMLPVIFQQLEEDATTVQFFDHIAFSPLDSKVTNTVRDNLKETAFIEELKSSLEKLTPYFQTGYQDLD